MLSTNNVTAAPHSTLLGLASFFAGLAPVLASASVPTSPLGWAAMGVGLIGGVLGIFGQNAAVVPTVSAGVAPIAAPVAAVTVDAKS